MSESAFYVNAGCPSSVEAILEAPATLLGTLVNGAIAGAIWKALEPIQTYYARVGAAVETAWVFTMWLTNHKRDTSTVDCALGVLQEFLNTPTTGGTSFVERLIHWALYAQCDPKQE